MVLTDYKVIYLDNLEQDIKNYVRNAPVPVYDVCCETDFDNSLHVELLVDVINVSCYELQEYLGIQNPLISFNTKGKRHWIYIECDALEEMLAKIYDVNVIALTDNEVNHYLLYTPHEELCKLS